jgi:hypothetical protein
MAFRSTGTGSTAKRKVKRPEVAGPYRSESSVPSIRKKATKREHRKVTVPSPSTSSSSRGSSSSTEPFAVPSLPKAIKRKQASLKRETARKIVRLKALNALEAKLRTERRAEGEPHTIVRQAKTHGTFPPDVAATTSPRAYKRADKIALAKLSQKENLGEPEDITHAIEAASLATGAGALVKAGAKGVSEVGAKKLLSSGASAGESIATRVGKAATSKARSEAQALRSYPARKAAKIKATPARVKRTVAQSPSKARAAVATKQGRRAAAQQTARSARRHPVRSGYGAAAISPVPLPGAADERARAFAEGSAKALVQHPAETLETTGRSLAGAITGPAALLGAAASSVKHGTPEPLVRTAEEEAKGVAHIVGQAFSGDTKKAELAARKEGSLALATPIPALTRLKGYERLRKGARAKVARGRRKLASRSERLNRNVRHAPEGTETHISGALGRHEHRKRTALLKQRIDNPERVATAHHEAAITHAAAKAPKGSDVAIQALAEYGVRGPKGAALLRHKGPGDKELAQALDYAEKHPEIYKSKEFEETLDAVGRAATTAPAALVGKGERARLLGQGDLLGISRPEHMVPRAARSHTSATSREVAWDDLHAKDLQLKALKRQGRERLNQAQVLKGAQRAVALAEGKAFYAKARKLFKENKALRDALADYVHPEHSIDQSKRKVYDDEMLQTYKAEVEAARKAAGLAPAIWTHHSPADREVGAGLPSGRYSKAAGVEHMREGALAAADNLDRSLEGLIHGTVRLPRQRAAGRQFMRSMVDEFKTPFTLRGKKTFVGRGSEDWKEITKAGGQFDPKTWGRFAYAEWKNALSDPFMSETDRSATLKSILEHATEGKVKGREPWVLMPREAIKEALAQIDPKHGEITKGLNVFSRITNRAILGTNPAWAVAQTVAEGIPILMANPKIALSAPAIYRDVLRYRKEHPENALALEATAGAAPISSAALRTPLDMQETYTPALWDRGAKALTRGKGARTALDFATLRVLGKIDAKRQNAYRSVLYAAEADKRFRSWHSGITGLFDRQAAISKRFRGRTRAEVWDWLQNDKAGQAERKKLEDYVDNVAGNWTAFTRFERAYGPAAIFYGFLRYSLRWSLWAFPRTHPVTATMAYMLGQANANQLEKLVGEGLYEEGLQDKPGTAKPSNPLAYALPVYSGLGGSKAVLSGGSRISPGQSSLSQALASGKPATVLSSANPFLSAGITGLTGVEPLSGEESSLPRGYAALRALINLPAPLRTKVPGLLDGQSIGEKLLEATGSPERSVAAQAYDKYDPGKTFRSVVYPGLPQTGANFKATEALSKSFDLKYGKGKVPGPFDNKLVQELLYGNNGKPKPQLLPRVLKAIHESEVGSAKVQAAEEPFYPGGASGDFTALQKKLLQAVEDAWKTGPSVKPRKIKRGGIGGGSGGIGGPSGASIGGPASGGIGGPNGISIGGP